MSSCKVVVLISGSGSNLQSLIDASHYADSAFEIVAVISNRPEVYGLTRASEAGIDAQTIDHTLYASREAFEQQLSEQIDRYQPNCIVLAGFMRILTPAFVEKYERRMFNIHPSLLPKYPGLNTHQRAIDAGDELAGATVHFVSAELDAGPAVLQGSVPIEMNDTAESLSKKVLVLEHKIYPKVIQWFAEQRLAWIKDRALLDGESLCAHGSSQSCLTLEQSPP